MLYIASVYQDPKASNRLLGTTDDGGSFVYDLHKGTFTWISLPPEPYDFIEKTLRISLRKLAKALVRGEASLSTERPYPVDYFVHPASPPQYR